MTTFFTADTHFGHKFMATLRGFSDTDTMDAWIIERWNKQAKTGDKVYLLGDVSFLSVGKTHALVEQLNGTIHLVRGNHDRKGYDALFASAQDYLELKIEKQKVVLMHYPLHTWNRSHYGSWHLHGHCHGNSSGVPGRLDVGLDCYSDFDAVPGFSLAALRSFESVKLTLEGDAYQSVDHH